MLLGHLFVFVLVSVRMGVLQGVWLYIDNVGDFWVVLPRSFVARLFIVGRGCYKVSVRVFSGLAWYGVLPMAPCGLPRRIILGFTRGCDHLAVSRSPTRPSRDGPSSYPVSRSRGEVWTRRGPSPTQSFLITKLIADNAVYMRTRGYVSPVDR